MKHFRITVLLAAVLAVPGVGAQSQSLRGMSLNGATGLYSIPTGRAGWEKTSSFGLDLGYHVIIKEKASHIPKLSVSLFMGGTHRGL